MLCPSKKGEGCDEGGDGDTSKTPGTPRIAGTHQHWGSPLGQTLLPSPQEEPALPYCDLGRQPPGVRRSSPVAQAAGRWSFVTAVPAHICCHGDHDLENKDSYNCRVVK